MIAVLRFQSRSTALAAQVSQPPGVVLQPQQRHPMNAPASCHLGPPPRQSQPLPRLPLAPLPSARRRHAALPEAWAAAGAPQNRVAAWEAKAAV
jgi:hypothetical protein